MQVTAQELQLTHKVHRCIQQQQWHQAKHYCQRLLKADPVDAQVHHLLGLVHVQIAAACNSLELRREYEERAVLAFEAATRHNPTMLEAKINLGHAYLQMQRNADALASYQAALRIAPASDLVYVSLAEAYRQQKDTELALASYGHAIQLAPKNPKHFIKTGNFLRELQRHEDAIAFYEQAIQLDSDNSDAYTQMALAMGELGHIEAAIGCCKIALEIDPKQSIALYQQALFEMRQGNEAVGIQLLDEALKLQPNFSSAWVSKGLILIKQQDFASAKSHLDRAIDLGAYGSDVFQSRALCLKELGDLDKAIDDLEKALEIDPVHDVSLMTLGTISHELKRYESALHLYTRAIQHCPGRVEAYSNLGAVLFDLNRHEDARITLEAALEIDPKMANAWSNLGANLKMLHRFDEALAAYNRVLELSPQKVDALCHKGLVLQDLKRMDEALACYERALEIEPENTLANWNKAFGLLLKGDFAHGWSAYEARWQHKKLNLALRSYAQPRWTGNEPLAGKRILVYCEQGLGDSLQFARFIPALMEQGAEVIFEVQGPLVSLMTRCLTGVRVLELGQPFADFDAHIPLLSLPAALQYVNEKNFTMQRFLAPSNDKIDEWKKRLPNSNRPRIGLAWSGNAAHQNDLNRSIPLVKLLNNLPERYDYICLQNEIRLEDQKALSNSPRVLDFSEDLKDFEDTAALCHLMDLVITVDTSVAHLSASLGKETWVMIPYSPDWRWMLQREDTPWYPSMHLFRQIVPGNWEQNLAKLASVLKTQSTDECFEFGVTQSIPVVV